VGFALAICPVLFKERPYYIATITNDMQKGAVRKDALQPGENIKVVRRFLANSRFTDSLLIILEKRMYKIANGCIDIFLLKKKSALPDGV